MILGLRAGHNINCLGAVHLLNEHKEVLIIYKELKAILEGYNHNIIDCNSLKNNKNEDLKEGCSKANKQPIDYFLSLHMNAHKGEANGVEAFTYSKSSKANSLASKLISNINKLGFNSRGLKHNADYYEMKNITAPNIILEILFTDNIKDRDLYNKLGPKKIAYCIANAIDPKIPFNIPGAETEVKPPVTESKQLYRVKSDGVQVGAYTDIKNILTVVESNLKNNKKIIQIEKV